MNGSHALFETKSEASRSAYTLVCEVFSEQLRPTVSVYLATAGLPPTPHRAAFPFCVSKDRLFGICVKCQEKSGLLAPSLDTTNENSLLAAN